jgi:hypothetical protein
MIRFILLQNRAGKTRLAKYYTPLEADARHALEALVHRTVTGRDPRHANVADLLLAAPGGAGAAAAAAARCRVAYRRYAGLFFVVGLDAADSALAALEAVHLFVEVLDHYFANVCELDLVFNFHKAYAILDELVLGGEVQETSKRVMLERLAEIDRLEGGGRGQGGGGLIDV